MAMMKDIVKGKETMSKNKDSIYKLSKEEDISFKEAYELFKKFTLCYLY